MPDLFEQLELLGCEVGTDESENIDCVQGYDVPLSKIVPLLRQLPNLRELWLAHAVADLPWSEFPQLPCLDVFNVDGTSIGDSDLGILRSFPRLTYLDLANTRVTDQGMVNVAQLTELGLLVLSNNAVTDEGLTKVHACKAVHHLYLQGTKVSETGVVAALRALPIAFMNLCNCSNITKDELAKLRSSYPAAYFVG